MLLHLSQQSYKKVVHQETIPHLKNLSFCKSMAHPDGTLHLGF